MNESAEPKEQLLRKIGDRSAIVGVVGLGYVGLPFAVEKAKVGFHVSGVERQQSRCDKVNAGENYILDVDDEELASLVKKGLIRASTGFEQVAEMDVIVICVPTPLTKNLVPNLSYVEYVAREIGPLLRPGQLITLESTTYPGTTDELLQPILEEASGLEAGKDIFVAYSPERVDPGNARYTTKNTNKVVGASQPGSLEVALEFYRQTIEAVVPVTSARAAEMTKVFENTFRSVNIALVNELALLCDGMGLDVWEVLDAANTKPFGIMPFYPGPGVGGHCIPIDPHYLEWKAKELNFNTHFIALAGEINRRMPEFVRDKCVRILNDNGLAVSKAKILVLGAAYKKDIEDARESPSIHIMSLLQELGANLSYHDSWIPEVTLGDQTLQSRALTPELVEDTDLIVIGTDHSEVDYGMVVERAKAVLDTRGITRKLACDRARVHLL